MFWIKLLLKQILWSQTHSTEQNISPLHRHLYVGKVVPDGIGQARTGRAGTFPRKNGVSHEA